MTRRGHRRNAWSCLIAGCCLLVLLSVGASPRIVEAAYSNGIGSTIASLLSAITGLVSFSLAEFVLAGTVVGIAGYLFLRLRSGFRRDRSWGSLLASVSLDTLSLSLWVAVTFYVIWGLNYSRPSLADRQNWGRLADARMTPEEHLAELERLGSALVTGTNLAFEQRWNSPLPTPDWRALDRSLDRAFLKVAGELGRPHSWAEPRGPAKPVLGSIILSYLGISGFYFPWTGEACFNKLVPDSQLALTIAHEKAHQRGIASEDEANFVGFLACLSADSSSARYSGLLFAQRQILTEVFRSDPESARRIASGRLEGVREDIRRSDLFWRRFEGPASQVGRQFNDSYLRLHGVVGGIESYRLSSRLLVLYARSRGGGLID